MIEVINNIPSLIIVFMTVNYEITTENSTVVNNNNAFIVHQIFI